MPKRVKSSAKSYTRAAAPGSCLIGPPVIVSSLKAQLMTFKTIAEKLAMPSNLSIPNVIQFSTKRLPMHVL